MRVIYDVMRDGLSAINRAADELAEARQQLSSGKRMAGVSDDPLATGQAISERATIGALDAYSRTRDAAASRLATLDSTLNSIVEKISAAIVTGTSARGSNVNVAARAAAAQEVRGLRASLVSDFNTEFDGGSIFGGTAVNRPAYAAVGGVWTYQGNADTMQVEVERGRLVSISFDGQAIAQGSDASDLFNTLDQLAADIEAGDNDAIGAGLAALDRAFDRAVRAQGRLGADERGVDDAVIRLATLRSAADARRSRAEDVNLAEVATRLAQADTSYRAALGAVSSAERQSLLDYLR